MIIYMIYLQGLLLQVKYIPSYMQHYVLWKSFERNITKKTQFQAQQKNFKSLNQHEVSVKSWRLPINAKDDDDAGGQRNFCIDQLSQAS